MSDSEKVLDFSKVMERLDDDNELFYELVNDFFDCYEDQHNKLADAITSKDYKVLYEVAHTVKGSLYTLGADKSGRIAFELEKIGKEKSDLAEIRPQLDILQSYVREFLQAVIEQAKKNGFDFSLNNKAFV